MRLTNIFYAKIPSDIILSFFRIEIPIFYTKNPILRFIFIGIYHWGCYWLPRPQNYTRFVLLLFWVAHEIVCDLKQKCPWCWLKTNSYYFPTMVSFIGECRFNAIKYLCVYTLHLYRVSLHPEDHSFLIFYYARNE